jgi:hypothetical protein
MDVDLRINNGANIFFGLAITSLAYVVLVPFSTLWVFLVPLYVAATPLLVLGGGSRLAGFLLGLVLVGVLIVFGVAGKRRMISVFAIGMVLYALDGLRAAIGALGLAGMSIAIGLGFVGILMVVVHAIALYIMWGACAAMLTARANETLARNWEVQSALARKLDEAAPVPTPPPAADFRAPRPDAPHSDP